MPRSFHDLAPRAQVMACVAFSALALGAAWRVLIQPLQTAISEGKSRLSTLEADARRAQLVALSLPVAQREVRALEISLETAEKVIPRAGDAQGLLRQLHDLAAESRLAITKFQPKPLVPRSHWAEWPIELGLEGGYHDVGRFLDRLPAVSQLIRITDLEIKARTSSEGRVIVSASCTATAIPIGTPLPPGGGYDDGGRRDPFESVVARSAGAVSVSQQSSTGLRAIGVADVRLRGYLRYGDKTMAIVEGAGRRSFVIRPGDRLRDATVQSIDRSGVRFANAGAAGPPVVVRKLLSLIEDVR